MARNPDYFEPGTKVQEAYQRDAEAWDNAMANLPVRLQIRLNLSQIEDNPVISTAFDTSLREAKRRLDTNAVAGQVRLTEGKIVFVFWEL
jgi:hypothetical protein